MDMTLRGKVQQAYANRAWIPNSLTALRLIGGIALIFLPLPSIAFYIVYVVCGLTDLLDGFLARRLKTASAFGAKLDSVADLTFYIVAMIRMLPCLRKRLPGWIWYVVAFVLALRLAAYLVAAIRLHRFAAVHTLANKATGAMVFGVGPMLLTSALTPYCIALAIVAAFSSAEELIMHLRETPAQN